MESTKNETADITNFFATVSHLSSERLAYQTLGLNALASFLALAASSWEVLVNAIKNLS